MRPLVEVGEETLQDHAQDRTTIEERQNENRPPQTERHEVGNRARILRIATFNYLATWMAQPISKEESLRANRYRESTPYEVDRLEQLMGDRIDLQQIRLFRWNRAISDITYGPARAVSESRRIAQQLVIYGRKGCENIFGRTTTLSLTAFLHNARAPTGEYAIARLIVVPAKRETKTLRRLQGRYRKKRNNALGEIRQQNHTDDNPPGVNYATK